MPKGESKKRYTGEFKQKAIEHMKENDLSYTDTASVFEVKCYHSIQLWERIYLEEVPEGLYKERRGRACSSGGTSKGRPPKLEKKVEEDLIAEVQRLRMEVDYLKKLNALVREREISEKKKKLR